MQNRSGFEHQIYENCHVEGLHISQETLSGSDFTECSFKEYVFEDCTLKGCSLNDCSFEGCRVLNPVSQGTQVKYLSFSKCHLLGVQCQDFYPPA